MKAFLILLFIGAVFMITVPASAQTCYANGDANNDSYGLTVADIVYLQRFLSGEVDSLEVPYQADINGDCVIDMLDRYLYDDFFVYGMSVFTPYGGYPVLTCCDAEQYCCSGIKGNIDYDPDDLINILDIVYAINYMYKGGPYPVCPMEVDVNGDGSWDILDITYLNNYLYKGGPAPVSCQ